MKRRWIYVGLSVTLGTVFAVGSLLILDTWVRSRFPLLNRHGYTGPVLGAKSQGEYRIAVLGGSTVLGYGMASWREAFRRILKVTCSHTLGLPISASTTRGRTRSP